MYDGAPVHFNVSIKDAPDSYSCKPVGPYEGHSFHEKCWNAGQPLTKIWCMLGNFSAYLELLVLQVSVMRSE